MLKKRFLGCAIRAIVLIKAAKKKNDPSRTQPPGRHTCVKTCNNQLVTTRKVSRRSGERKVSKHKMLCFISRSVSISRTWQSLTIITFSPFPVKKIFFNRSQTLRGYPLTMTIAGITFVSLHGLRMTSLNRRWRNPQNVINTPFPDDTIIINWYNKST